MQWVKGLLNRFPPPARACRAMNEPLKEEMIPVVGADVRRRYIDEQAGKIEGWNGPGAFELLNCIDAIHKNRLGVSGAVAEIGVHHGQFFIYLAMLRGSGEKAFACDVFERQDLNKDGSGGGNSERAVFERNLLECLGSLAGIVIASQSSDTLSQEYVAASVGPIRIISIDGGHWRDIVVNDLCVAASCLHENGIAVLDDVFDMYWPGVAEGLTCYLWDAYEQGAIHARLPPKGRLVPFAVGCNKTLLCFENKYKQWIELFEEYGPQNALKAKQPGWKERPVLIYDFEIPAEELWEALQRETQRRMAAEAALRAAADSLTNYLKKQNSA
jgi:hypothetical protein